jgi:transcriptional regulator with XRE-family HTH domain
MPEATAAPGDGCPALDVAAVRQRLGLSQRQIAARLGVDPTTWNQCERGHRRATRFLLERLATAVPDDPQVRAWLAWERIRAGRPRLDYRAVRGRLGLTQWQMAALVGVPVRNWGAYERGTDNPGAAARARLAPLMAIEPAAAGGWDGDGLRARRLEAGLTQRRLARRLGVTPETVCRWEQGRTRPLVVHWKLLDAVLSD